jgi:hypothetical protein
MVNEDFQLVAVGVELLRGVDVEGSENNGAPGATRLGRPR